MKKLEFGQPLSEQLPFLNQIYLILIKFPYNLEKLKPLKENSMTAIAPITTPAAPTNIETEQPDLSVNINRTEMVKLCQSIGKLAFAEGQAKEINNTVATMKVVSGVTALGIACLSTAFFIQGALKYWDWYQSTDGKYTPMFGSYGGLNLPEVALDRSVVITHLIGLFTLKVSNSFCKHAIEQAEKRKTELFNVEIQEQKV